MRILIYILNMGIGFTFGLLCGLLIHLPADTLPAASPFHNGHESGRVKREVVADIPGIDTRVLDIRNVLAYSEASLGGLPNIGLNRVRDVAPGSALGEQIPQSDLHSRDYPPIVDNNPAENPLKHPIKSDNTRPIALLGQYGDNNSRSVVYVNPEGRKLVLDNNVNTVNDTARSDRARGSNQQLDNLVVKGQVTRTDPGHHQNGRIESKSNSNMSGKTLNAMNVIKDNVFWGPAMDAACPMGFSETDYTKWRSKTSSGKFVKMETGCGRMQNRKLQFQDSEKACVRYRLNVDQIQGEVYSFYLAKLLGIKNVVPSTLQLADSNLDLWRMVGEDVTKAQWSEEKPLIVSEWVKDLNPAYIPIEFRNLSRTFRGKYLQNKLQTDSTREPHDTYKDTINSLCELYQWSDLIVFDYITGNLDRVVNNLFNLQWNDRMMSKPAHNLERDSRGTLVFLDNESGLFHGYRLLDRYSTYHESLLNALCVFKESTIRSIRDLVQSNNIGDELQSLLEQNEPLHRHLPKIPVKNVKILKQRLLEVLQQVEKCSSDVH